MCSAIRLVILSPSLVLTAPCLYSGLFCRNPLLKWHPVEHNSLLWWSFEVPRSPEEMMDGKEQLLLHPWPCSLTGPWSSSAWFHSLKNLLWTQGILLPFFFCVYQILSYSVHCSLLYLHLSLTHNFPSLSRFLQPNRSPSCLLSFQSPKLLLYICIYNKLMKGSLSISFTKRWPRYPRPMQVGHSATWQF